MECEFLMKDGICNGHLDVCCIYQRTIKRDDDMVELKSVRECYCNYPVAVATGEYARAIRDLANFTK